MKHYSSPREKKILALGLVALLALPEAALPPEVRPGMPQVRAHAPTCAYGCWSLLSSVEGCHPALLGLGCGAPCTLTTGCTPLLMPRQVTSAVLRLLLALKTQQEEHRHHGGSDDGSGNESGAPALAAGAGAGAGAGGCRRCDACCQMAVHLRIWAS